MPPQTKTRSTAARRRPAPKKAPAPAVEKNLVDQATEAAKSALNIPVGAALLASEGLVERVSELVTPFRERETAEKEFKTYRTELRRELKRFERRGHKATARVRRELRKSRTRLRRSRTRVERTIRQNRTRATRTVRPYRHRVETQLRRGQGQVEKNVTRLQSQVGDVVQDQGKRAQRLIDEVALQVQALS